MHREAVLLLLIGHFLGDFYFQPDDLARKQTITKLLKHALIYTMTMLVVILPVFNWTLFLLTLIISITHLIIDYLKMYIKRHKSLNYIQNILLYLLDQTLHIGIILITGIFLVMKQIEVTVLPILMPFFQQFTVQTVFILSWVLMILVVCKPASITIRIVLKNFEPKGKQEEDAGIQNAGALIGIFERLIILFMLHAGQFGAIGFVLTAKSVARYNKIQESPQFAEYYLLGTLLSSLIIIVTYYLIF